jgi:hypothetical protein
MTKMLPPSFGPISSIFGDDPKDDSLGSGISTSYPILRIKGKVWSITRGGNEPHVLMRQDGDGPRNSIEVVIVAASQYVSKVWYEQGYEEGATNAPDCFSPNGIVPDASSTKKQNNTCKGCPQDAWGSKITPAGKKAKACQDSKRIAVVPHGDLRNEAFGGPMLLRVPAASLSAIKAYDDQLKAYGHKFYTVGTRLSFDPGEAYPKLVLEPLGSLKDDQAIIVKELRESSVVQAILAEGTDVEQEAYAAPVVPKPIVTPKVTVVTRNAVPQSTSPASTPVAPVMGGNGFGEPTSSIPPLTGTNPKAVKATKPAAPPPQPLETKAPAPQEGAATADNFEDTLDAQIEALLPGAT